MRWKARALAAKLDAIHAGPAEVRADKSLFKVVTRVYPSLGDANLAKPYIVGNGFADAYAVSEFQPEKAAATNIVAKPFGDAVPSVASLGTFNQDMFDFVVTKSKLKSTGITPALEAVDNEQASDGALFQKAFSYQGDVLQGPRAISALDAYIKRFPGSSRVVEAKLKRAYWFVSIGDISGAKAAFSEIAEKFPDTQAAGEASLRLGYLHIREQDYAGALRLFHSVAAGEIPASADVRAEAMLRTAALFHRGKDLPAADKCYEAILAISTDPELRAFADVHRAGIKLEMAWNGKATFEQARVMCDEILKTHRTAPKAIRATAALMALETLAYEQKYPEMIKREPRAMAEMAETVEASLGMYWIAKARFETGDFKRASEILETLINTPPTTEKRFKNVDLSPQARRLASKVYEKLGDTAKAQKVMDYQH